MIISPDIEGILKRLVLLPADLNRTRLIMKNLDKKIDNRPKIERILFKDFKPKSGECLLELFLNESNLTHKIIEVEKELRNIVKKREEKSRKKIIEKYGIELDPGLDIGDEYEDEYGDEYEAYLNEASKRPRYRGGGKKSKKKQKKTIKNSKKKTRKFSKKRLTKRNTKLKKSKKKSNK